MPSRTLIGEGADSMKFLDSESNDKELLTVKYIFYTTLLNCILPIIKYIFG
jgi:hypothetical protein